MNKYPYTEFNTYNLDWIIRRLKELEVSVDTFEALNSITFGGNWSIDHQYPKWTIVNHPETHDAYMSLQPVPVNVPITNEDYWLKIGDYTDGLAVVDARVDALEDWKDETVPVIEDHAERIAAAEHDIDILQNRKILIFGDSYFSPNPVYGGNSFGYYLQPMIAGIPGVEVEIKSDGGEGFAQSATYAFLYDVTNYVPSFPADEITDIFFVGGYNDRNHTISDILYGMEQCFNLCHTKYPNAKISCGHFGWSAHLASTNRDAIVGASLQAWHRCTEYGAGYMTNAEYTMHNYDLFHTDNFHPIAQGEKELAKQVVNYIRTGSCDVHYPYKSIAFNNGGAVGVWTDSAYTIGYKLDNDIVTVYMPTAQINYSINAFDLDPTTNTYTSILQLTTTVTPDRGYAIGMYDGAYNVQPNLPIAGWFLNSSGTFRSWANCQITINGGFLKIRPFNISPQYSGYQQYVDITAMKMAGGAYTIPTLSC